LGENPVVSQSKTTTASLEKSIFSKGFGTIAFSFFFGFFFFCSDFRQGHAHPRHPHVSLQGSFFGYGLLYGSCRIFVSVFSLQMVQMTQMAQMMVQMAQMMVQTAQKMRSNGPSRWQEGFQVEQRPEI